MTNLRWFVERRAWESWNSRFDEYETHSMESIPKLQYENDAGEWIDVPIVMEVKPFTKESE